MTDICIILEGTYPYKTGGVGTWTDMLIRGLPQFSFSIVHIYAGKLPALAVYPLPPNVHSVVTVPLTTKERRVSISHLLSRIPEARCYHALSTGFAGMIATEMKRRKSRPFLLTEHGIYWHEIAQGVDELECGFKMIELEGSTLNLGTTWQGWLATFKTLAVEAYRTCDALTTVCAFNKTMQISLDPTANKCRVIHNAVPSRSYERFRVPERPRDPASIALVGRVTKLKDIRTFINACAQIRTLGIPATFSVFGPTDQDPQYYSQCLEWRDATGLHDLRFEGSRPPRISIPQWICLSAAASPKRSHLSCLRRWHPVFRSWQHPWAIVPPCLDAGTWMPPVFASLPETRKKCPQQSPRSSATRSCTARWHRTASVMWSRITIPMR